MPAGHGLAGHFEVSGPLEEAAVPFVWPEISEVMVFSVPARIPAAREEGVWQQLPPLFVEELVTVPLSAAESMGEATQGRIRLTISERGRFISKCNS